MRESDLGRLAKLNELRAAGALTDNEFEDQKAKLLSAPIFLLHKWPIFTVLAVCALGIIAAATFFLTRETSKLPINLATSQPIAKPTSVVAATASPIATPATPPARLQPAWVGSYRGTVEGATGSMSIKERPNGKVFVDLGVGSPKCSGGITFSAKPDENLIQHDFPYDADSQLQCSMTLVKNGTRIVVQEHECSAYHGFECSFNGTFQKSKK